VFQLLSTNHIAEAKTKDSTTSDNSTAGGEGTPSDTYDSTEVSFQSILFIQVNSIQFAI